MRERQAEDGSRGDGGGVRIFMVSVGEVGKFKAATRWMTQTSRRS
jgi:hypothetical protein